MHTYVVGVFCPHHRQPLNKVRLDRGRTPPFAHRFGALPHVPVRALGQRILECVRAAVVVDAWPTAYRLSDFEVVGEPCKENHRMEGKRKMPMLEC